MSTRNLFTGAALALAIAAGVPGLANVHALQTAQQQVREEARETTAALGATDGALLPTVLALNVQEPGQSIPAGG
jgi:hypothetical protein